MVKLFISLRYFSRKLMIEVVALRGVMLVATNQYFFGKNSKQPESRASLEYFF